MPVRDFKKGAPDTRARQETPPAYGGGGVAGKEGSRGTEEEEEEREGDLASAVILPRPRPPGASSHLRHGDKETEALTAAAAAAAAAGKHSKLNRLIPAAINTAVTRRKKTTARLILGETRQDKSLPPTGSRGRDSQRPNRGAKGRTGRRGRVGRLRRE